MFHNQKPPSDIQNEVDDELNLSELENNQNENFVKNYICDVPKKRLLKSHEIGPVIEGLFNSNYITGTSIFLDGGKNLY